MRLRALKISLALGVAALAALGAAARLTAIDALRSMPFEVSAPVDSPTVDNLIEYTLASLSTHTEPNLLGGTARILNLDSVSASLQTGVGRTLHLYLLPERKDTLLLLIETIDAPQPDSRLHIYSRNWTPRANLWSEPAAIAPDSIELTRYSFDPQMRELRLERRFAGSDSIVRTDKFSWTAKGFRQARN